MIMMSVSKQHKQNPEAGSEAADHINVKSPFSIRNYVHASRHRNIFHSWPFHEKHLQMCLDRDIKNVLPPFEHQAPLAKSLSNLMHSQKGDGKKPYQFCKTEVQQQYYHDIEQPPQNITKNEGDDDFLSHEKEERSYKEGNQHNNIIKCSTASVSNNVSESADHVFTLPIPTSSIHDHKSFESKAPSKAMLKEKRRTGRRRCKMRSMVDILAVARHCTSEEIYRINKFCYTTQTVINEASHQRVPCGSTSKSMPKGHQNSFRKAASRS